MTDFENSKRVVVLVVEDEPVLRMSAVDMVEDAGFEVAEAADATQAVRILERRTDIRIVFTDIDMPRGVDGMEMAVLIRDRWPPIHIVLTSGAVQASDVEMPPRSVFFAKPYNENDVIAMLRKFAAS